MSFHSRYEGDDADERYDECEQEILRLIPDSSVSLVWRILNGQLGDQLAERVSATDPVTAVRELQQSIALAVARGRILPC